MEEDPSPSPLLNQHPVLPPYVGAKNQGKACIVTCSMHVLRSLENSRRLERPETGPILLTHLGHRPRIGRPRRRGRVELHMCRTAKAKHGLRLCTVPQRRRNKISPAGSCMCSSSALPPSSSLLLRCEVD